MIIKENSLTAILSSLAFLVFLVSNCDQEPKTEYQKEIDQALVSQVEKDSLILEYKFGMTKEEFFEYSWDINKQGVVVNGAGAEIVQDVDWLKSPARRSFYPNFIEDQVVQLPVDYSYNGWAPWNSHLVSDSLLVDLIDNIESEYGGTFKNRVIENGDTVYYQVQGNREIRVETMDQTKVRVTFTDLSKLTSGTN